MIWHEKNPTTPILSFAGLALVDYPVRVAFSRSVHSTVFHNMKLHLVSLLLVLAVLPFTGCRDQKITAYRAPKDPAPVMAAAAPAQMAPGATLPDGHPAIGGEAAPASAPGAMTGNVPTAEGMALLWTAPAHWTAKSLGAMRKGSYAIAGEAGAVGDLAITAFPGDTGGLFANVNRWRGQVGLGPIEAAQIEASVQNIEANGLQITITEATGQANGVSTTLLGAIVPHEGQTWFFKLIGPAALITREQTAFREFLSTIKPR